MSNSLLASVLSSGNDFVAGVEELGSMDSVAAWMDGVELGAAESEMEVAVSAVETTSDWVGGIESLIEYMEEHVESGMSPEAAALVGRQMDARMAEARIEKQIVAGVESFQGESSAQAATVAGIEEGDNFLKKIWQSIKNAVYRAITAVKNFFAKLFGGWKKLKAQHKNLESKVDKLDDSYKSKKLEVKNAQHLHVDGKLDPKDLVEGFKNLGAAAERAKVLADVYQEALDVAAGKLETLKDSDDVKSKDELKAIADKKEEAEKSLTKVDSQLPGGVRATLKNKVTTSDEYRKQMADKSGGIANPDFVAWQKHMDQLVASSVEITKADSSRVKASKELDEFTKSDIKAIHGYLGAVIDKAIEANQNLDTMNASRKKFVDTIDVLINAADKGSIGKLWDKGKIRWLSRRASKDLTKPVNKFFQTAFTSTRAGMSLVSDLT